MLLNGFNAPGFLLVILGFLLNGYHTMVMDKSSGFSAEHQKSDSFNLEITDRYAFRSAEDDRTHIAFVIAEDEYNAHLTLPAFAKNHLSKGENFTFNFIQSDEPEIHGMKQIRDADLVILYVRRRHPPESQLNWLRGYLEAGKPLIALRTSSHAFETWVEFDPEVLGGNYTGHHGNHPPEDPATFVQIDPEMKSHSILRGLPEEPVRVASWLYKTRPLADDVVPLMYGRIGDSSEYEPVTWIREYKDAKIFYTSLGHPQDFENPVFIRLLKNAIQWATHNTEIQ